MAPATAPLTVVYTVCHRMVPVVTGVGVAGPVTVPHIGEFVHWRNAKKCNKHIPKKRGAFVMVLLMFSS